MRIVMGLLLSALATTAVANECKFSEPRNLDIDAAGLHALALTLGSTDLHATGVPGLKRVEVRARACASERDRLAGLKVDQRRDGDRLTITPTFSGKQSSGWFGSNYAYIELHVRVPADLPVRVNTHSGDAEVRDVAALAFDSHSGDLIAHEIAGQLTASVHSGDVQARDIGNMRVNRSGSGDVHADKVNGDVVVGRIGSGDLGFDDVKGNVSVESAGSGDIGIRHAGGSVTVGSIGSGDVYVNDVGGDFVVRSIGSGDITRRGVKGRVDIPHRYDD